MGKFETILEMMAKTYDGATTVQGDGWGTNVSDPLNPFALNAHVTHYGSYDKKEGPGDVRIDYSDAYRSWWPTDLKDDHIWAMEFDNDQKTGITIVKIGTNIDGRTSPQPINYDLKSTTHESGFAMIDFKTT